MSKRLIAITFVVAIALSAALSLQGVLVAQQRPGGGPGGPGGAGRGGPGGMRGGMAGGGLGIENSWAYVSFELGVPDEQLAKVRKVYQGSWEATKKLRDEATASGSFEGMREKSDKIRADLNASLKNALTAEQLKKLADWEAEQQQRAQQMQQRFGGGGGGQGRQ